MSRSTISEPDQDLPHSSLLSSPIRLRVMPVSVTSTPLFLRTVAAESLSGVSQLVP